MFKATMRSLTLVTALLALTLVGCGKKASHSTPTVCPNSFCGGHGVCAESTTLPTCDCLAGYTALTCGTCAAGYHRAGSSNCVVDAVCAPETCGAHGTCAITAGVAGCTCADGYDGLQCEGCAPGFLFVPDANAGLDGGPATGTCLLREVCSTTACAPGFNCDDSSGKVVCSCSGFGCSQCTDGICGEHGTCDDSSGNVACTCATGYVGAACASCHIGYSMTEGGTCALNERCTQQTCSGAGSCDASTGVARCSCDTGATGDNCESCATGYHRDTDGRCAVNQTCASDSCGPSATCDDSTGAIACTCLTGFAGQLCDYCYPGYHRDGADCLLDEQCTATSCGAGICDDATGVVVCDCPSGTLGDHCEQNVNDCGSSCGSGQCIDLVDAFQCLCSDGTWGQSCLPGPTILNIAPASGDLRGGTTITITGSGFSGSSVTIGGASGTNLSVDSDTQVRVTVPPAQQLGAADVTITSATLQKAHGTFTYVPATFSYTGTNQTFVIPAGVTALHVQTWGAGGGMGDGEGVRGGAGGYAAATLTVTPGDTYTLVVGQGGTQVSASTKAGSGGGASGLFLGTPSQETAVVMAGGGGGGGSIAGSSGGNGGGEFGLQGGLSGAGLGGNPEAGGIGGCVASAPCGQNGSALKGGGGTIPNIAAPRTGATFGGGAGVGSSDAFSSAGGGGGYFGGGGAADGGAGGGAGFVAADAMESDLSSGTVSGEPSHADALGFVAGVASGGSATTVTGGDGLILLSW
jgi:hypothetical protein